MTEAKIHTPKEEYEKSQAAAKSGDFDRRIPRIVNDHDISDEEMLKAMAEPSGVVVRKPEEAAMRLTPAAIGVAITFRNFQQQRDMLITVKRKKEAEIESVKAEMRKLNDTYEKLQRELFVTQAKEEAVRAAIRSMEDRGVNE